MAATVQIVIEADDAGAAATLENLNASAAQLTPTLRNVGMTSDSVFSQMQSNIHSTQMVTDLLAGNASRAENSLIRMAAATSALGPIIASAFAPFAIITFGDLILRSAENIAKLVTGEKAAEEAAKALQKAHEEAFKAIEQSAAESNKFQEELATVGLKGAAALRAEADIAHQIAAQEQARLAGMKVMVDLQQQMVNQEQQAYQATKSRNPIAAGAMPDQSPTLKAESAALQQLKTDMDQYNTTVQKGTDAATLYDEKAKAAFGEEQQQNLKKSAEAADEWNKKFITDIEEVARKYGEWEKQAEQYNTAFIEDIRKTAEEWTKYQDQEAEKDKKYNEMKAKGFEQLDMQMVNNMVADQKVAANAQEQAKKYTEAWTHARDTMASQLDSFFRELTSGNIGKTFLTQFEKMVSQMVATWLMGIQGMQGAVTRSGGLFGSLGNMLGLGGGGAGGMFGGGAGAAGGALDSSAFSFSPSSAGFTGPEAAMLGLPLSSGVGGGALGGVLPAGASIALGGAGGPLGGSAGFGGLLSGLSSLLPIGALAGGSALLGKGGIFGALGSGALGYGAGAVAGPLLTSLSESAFLSGNIGAGLASTLGTIGSFLGPIGAGIGLVAGLIGLFTGKGKLKVQQTQLLQQMEQQLTNLQNAYDVHQVDYNSAINQAEQIRTSYDQQQEALQQGGSAGRVDPWVNATEAHINQVEQQRQSSLTAAAGYGPAQFSAGGFVHPSMARTAPPGFAAAMHFATGGAVPAIVHAGEYVLNAAAVNRYGVGNLDAINSGRGGPVIHMENHFHAMDANSFEGWMASGEGSKAFSRSIRRAISEGRM